MIHVNYDQQKEKLLSKTWNGNTWSLITIMQIESIYNWSVLANRICHKAVWNGGVMTLFKSLLFVFAHPKLFSRPLSEFSLKNCVLCLKPCEITEKAATWFADLRDIVSRKRFFLTPNGLSLIKVQSIFSSRISVNGKTKLMPPPLLFILCVRFRNFHLTANLNF